MHIFFSHDRNKTEVEEDQLENLITKNPLALKAIFESDNEAQKRQTLILLKNLVSRKPSAVQLLAQAYQSARFSVDYLREESQKNPDKYLRTFAGSLMILASCYRDEGNLEESLKNIIEAVEIRKYLYQKNPEIFTPTLAGTLNSLSAAYSNVGKYENALDATKEAIELYRTLTESDPLKYKPILRGTLYCLAACYKYFDKNNEAKNAMDEAASLVRE